MDRASVEDFFAVVAPLSVRPMFGGHGVYRDGLMFAIELAGEFYLKIDAETQARFAEAGSSPCIYQGRTKPIAMSYWRVPDAAVDDPEALKAWCALAIDAARRKAKPVGAKPARRRKTT